MGQILDFLAEKEIIILCSIIAVLSFVLMILFIQEAYMKARKRAKLKQNTQELKNLTQEVAIAKKTQKVEKPSMMSNIKEIIPPKKQKEVTAMDQIVSNKKVEQVVQPPIKEKRILDNFSPIGPMPVTNKVLEKAPIERSKIIQAKPAKVEQVASQEKEVKPKVVEVLKSVQKEKPHAIQQEPIVYKDEVYTKKEAQQELKRLTETLQKEEQENIELTAFEAKQEEDAIISLEELLARGKQLIQENEEIQYQDDGNEPISLQDLERKVRAVENVEVKVDTLPPKEKIEKQPVQDAPPKVVLQDLKTAMPQSSAYRDRKYIPTPVISPVFGLEEGSSTYRSDALRLENTANFEKLDDEIRKTNEFLALLKELEKKLD